VLIDEHLCRMAETFPDEAAYAVVDGDSLTFAQWEGLANAMARGLVASGLAPGDRVGLQLEPAATLRWLVSYTAIHRAGGVAVPMNPRLARAEVGHLLAHSRASVLVADGPRVARTLDERHANLSMVVDAATEPRLPDSPGRVVGWHEIIGGSQERMQVPRAMDDLADILYTSGTTGRPKGVAIRHANGSMIGDVAPSWSAGGWFHASPLFTFAGMAFVYTPMKLGLQGIYQATFDADRWLQVVERDRPVAVFLVPTMAHLLVDHPRFATA
jgi:long-chain acyl-CoA synthetase